MFNSESQKRITPEQFAKNNNLSRNTVYRMLRRGDIVAVKMGSQWRIDEAATIEKLEHEQ